MRDPIVDSVLHEIDEETPLIEDNITQKPQERKKRGMSTFLRWFLIVLAVLAVAVGIAVPVIFYSVIPNYIKTQIDSSPFQVHSVYFHSLYPNYVECQMNFTLGRLEYDFKFTNIHVELSHNGTQIASFNMDELTSLKKVPSEEAPGDAINVVRNITIKIENESRFSLLLQDLLIKNATLGLTFSKYHLDIYDVPVLTSFQVDNMKFTKYFDILSFQQFDPVTVSHVGVERIQNVDELTFWISLRMKMTNPSILFFYLNHYAFKLLYKYEDKYMPIGIVAVKQVYIRENVDTGAYLSISPKYFGNHAVISSFMSNIVHHDPLVVQIASFGHSGEFYPSPQTSDIAHIEAMPRLHWLENGLTTLQVNLTISDYPFYPVFIDSVAMSTLEMKIEQDYMPLLSGHVISDVSLPSEFDVVDITDVRMTFEMCYYTRNSHCLPIGYVKSGFYPANLTRKAKKGVRKMEVLLNPDFRQDGQLVISNKKNYEEFIREFVIKDTVTVKIMGYADAQVNVYERSSPRATGIVVSGIQFSTDIDMEGMNIKKTDPPLVYYGNNLDVTSVQTDNSLFLEMPDTWMKRVGKSGRQVGLIVKRNMDFKMNFFEDEKKTSFDVGRVSLPYLRLSESNDCATHFNHTLLNQTFDMEVPYCRVNPIVFFKSDTVHDYEECNSFAECPGRQFLSRYLTGHTLLHKKVQVELEAQSLPADFNRAKDVLNIRADLPGYIPAVGDGAPFNLVHRIIVQPSTFTTFMRGYMNCWLEFYNPLSVPIRYYYISVDTYLNNAFIGKLHINMTQYDPFQLKEGYEFKGYLPRKGLSKDDTYGPHPHQRCINLGDCQIAPFDLPVSNKIHRTKRLEVSFRPTIQLFRLWKSLFQNEVNVTVTVKGKVIVGVGAKPYDKPRNDTRGREDDIDPYWSPPVHEKLLVSWLDYGQENTQLTFTKTAIGLGWRRN